MQPTEAVGGVTYYRVVGDGSDPEGEYWSTTPPTGMSRNGLAIKGDWNSMTGVVEFTPAGGETIPAWHGKAAPQSATFPDGTPGHYPGGDDQVWVPRGSFNDDNGNFTIHQMDN